MRSRTIAGGKAWDAAQMEAELPRHAFIPDCVESYHDTLSLTGSKYLEKGAERSAIAFSWAYSAGEF